MLISFFLFCRLEHAKMHARHKGHEAMHAEMVLILIVTLVIAQLVLVQWKQRHPKSYNVSQLFSSLSHTFLYCLEHNKPGVLYRMFVYLFVCLFVFETIIMILTRTQLVSLSPNCASLLVKNAR